MARLDHHERNQQLSLRPDSVEESVPSLPTVHSRTDSRNVHGNVKYLVPVILALACVSCSTGMDAMTSTLQDAFRGKASSVTQLNPSYRYIKVSINTRVAFLALGDVDKNAVGPVEVWYSASREVLRLQNGRVAGATGLTTEWRSVLLDEAPSWPTAIGAAQPLRWTRVRDVMPGYRFGTRDQLELRTILPLRNVSLQGYDSQRLHWFEEQTLISAKGAAKAARADQALPAARYAVDLQGDTAVVVYSEQCLAPGLCFSWQLWKP
jgi:hypothetical protein